VDLRTAADEAPDVAIEGAELLLHREEEAGVGDGRLDLEALRMIPGSDRRRSTARGVMRATRAGAKSWKARRKPSRLRNTTAQLSPAWKASKTRNSKIFRSSWTGTPHSSSW
jgi:hypothetical protein